MAEGIRTGIAAQAVTYAPAHGSFTPLVVLFLSWTGEGIAVSTLADFWLGMECMERRLLTSDWLLQPGIAVGYGLLYLAIHPFATAHWPIHAGVRLACLLLMPYRFWPALLIGEALPNAYEVYPYLASLGPIWVAIRSIPPFAVAMPIVWWCRSRMPPFPSKSEPVVDIKALLICILLVSLGNMAYSWTASATATTVTSLIGIVPWMATFFLGPYLAILTIVPWVLMLKLDYQSGRLRQRFHDLWGNRLLLDTVAILIPSLGALAWLDQVGSDQVKQIATVAMFFPMAWLTLKHGWRAVAVSAPFVIACILLPIDPTEDSDPKTYVAQVFLTIAVTSLFVLGARISAQLQQEEQERLAALNVQRFARQSLQMSEQRMRQTSQALEYLAGTLHITNGRLLDQMRRVMPNIESHAFYKQAMAMQNQVYRLAESMHPVAWRERGLPAALNETIARALDEAGIAYRCQISGRGFTRLAPTVLTATYRVACETVVYVTSRLACTRVNLILRGGETRGRRWIVLRVEGVLENTGVANAVYYSEQRKRLAAKLGASGFDIPEIKDQVQIFGGGLRLRTPQDRLSLTILLHDVRSPEAEQQLLLSGAAPLRLWVK